MTDRRPNIPEDMLAKWQRVIDLAAAIVDVPASLVMKTDPPDHAVLISSRGEGNPYEVGQSFELNSKLYCYAVLQRCDELVVRDAHADPEWSDNQDLEHGMSFYVGYPLVWPDGVLFGTICVLDRTDNAKIQLCRQLLSEFRRVIEGDLVLLMEVARRERAERELHATLAALEDRVAARTRDLREANAELKREVTSRRRTEKALLEREQELEDANTALRVLLANVESSRREFETQILKQLKGLVLPHLAKLQEAIGDEEPRRSYVDLVETNLNAITSTFADRLLAAFESFTATEIEIAQMVMSGRTTKDIARALSRETSTIDFHRNNIRKKLGIERRRVSLRTYLLSLS